MVDKKSRQIDNGKRDEQDIEIDIQKYRQIDKKINIQIDK